uniref:Uncharacterized protein n=1 Tax=Arundo donax TaxID=35708 RepID=A0A0A9B9Q8_ARUDO
MPKILFTQQGLIPVYSTYDYLPIASERSREIQLK